MLELNSPIVNWCSRYFAYQNKGKSIIWIIRFILLIVCWCKFCCIWFFLAFVIVNFTLVLCGYVCSAFRANLLLRCASYISHFLFGKNCWNYLAALAAMHRILQIFCYKIFIKRLEIFSNPLLMKECIFSPLILFTALVFVSSMTYSNRCMIFTNCLLGTEKIVL